MDDQLILYYSIIFAIALTLSSALPSSLVDEIKSSELRENKVKRSHSDPINPEQNNAGGSIPYYTKPTAIKRGTNLKTPSIEQQLTPWDKEQMALYPNENNILNIPASLYSNGGNGYDDKSVAEYEKGFQYAVNKDKLDEALENAVLKSELYDGAGSINQDDVDYFNSEGTEKRRRRRDVKKLRLTHRFKRELELTPEEILTLLSLYETSRQQQPNFYHFQPIYNQSPDDDQSDDETWLNAPVLPHINPVNDITSNYILDDEPPKHIPKWAGYNENEKKKRFMVAKKRNNDPTRELRYLNGPNKNDFYTLSQLLSNQREPNVPLYHRLVL